jgi:hypothetical protein
MGKPDSSRILKREEKLIGTERRIRENNKQKSTRERRKTCRLLLLVASWEAGRLPLLSIWGNTWQKKGKKLPLS